MKWHFKRSLRYGVIGAGLTVVLAVVVSLALPLPSRWTIEPARNTQSDASYRAYVIKVSDGDTITVRLDNENIKIRLAEIDAPEKGQAWGTKSRGALSDLVAGKHVRVLPNSKDRYGRTVAHVELEGQNVNRIMVEQGAAWAYPAYVRDAELFSLEAQAREARRGLWAMPDNERQPPWDYRAARRDKVDVVVGR